MKVILYLAIVAVIATVAMGHVTGPLLIGTCLCLNGNGVNVRRTACGTILGTANRGSCFRYNVGREWCTLNGQSYEFYYISYGTNGGWVAGNFLNKGEYFNCG